MKKYLLTKEENTYRANLHCHTNVSDGALSPEDVKKIYMEHGYSIVAYTDHRVHLKHDELTDENFLALSGVEYDVNEKDKEKVYRKCCHICMIALDKENDSQPCYNKELNFHHPENHAVVNPDGTLPEFEMAFKNVSAILKKGREDGFFVTYNHPTWSMEDYSDYMKYHGMHAMEISNYGCITTGFPEYNARIYDDILRSNERIFAIATDDNHNKHAVGSTRWDSFGGYTMINAKKLEYKTITDALLAGKFYSVTGDGGAQIKELWYEDGKVHVECTEAVRIDVITGRRKCYTVIKPLDTTVTEGDFEVIPEDIYFRISITDKHGNHTDTNAYFIDTL